MSVLLGDDESRLTLHSALHTPAISYTLVSIGALDAEVYHAHIGGGSLELTSPQGEHIRCIPCTQGHLYKIVPSAGLSQHSRACVGHGVALPSWPYCSLKCTQVS